jgi:GNAT superfamily N-acetyltransferase
MSDEKPSHKFVNDMYTRHKVNPLNDREFYMSHEKGHAFFDISPSGDREAHIHYFRTHPRKAGVGTHALKTLQDHAKRHGVSLHLGVGGHETPKRVLTKFYKKHGFKGHAEDMTWKPDDVNEDIAAPTNNVGGGAVAGLGIGPQGEPGRSAKLMPLARRRANMLKKVIKEKWPTVPDESA